MKRKGTVPKGKSVYKDEMQQSESEISFVDEFAQLSDPRSERNRLYSIEEILLLSLLLSPTINAPRILRLSETLKTRQKGFKEVGCVEKRGVGISHNDIDSVKVFFASETPGEVGVWIDGGVKFRAERAEESEISLGVFMRYIKDVGDEPVDGYVVS